MIALVFFVLPANVIGIEDIGAQEAAAQEKTTTGEGEGNKIAGFLAWVTLGIASLFGKLLTIVTGIVNWLFTWQDFESEGVIKGWVIVRDLCNMFFILVLLMIAFATILRLENYSMKKYLPKLLIIAVLINFSKTICLFLIDVSQIVMLTFGNAFAGASSNFVTMLHIDKLLQISNQAKFGEMPWDMFYASGLALIFMLIAFFVMVMLMGILIMRLIMFWVLIVLSPMAFLAVAVPGGGKYWSQWWGEFSKYLIVGPVLAFFTWLSLTVAKNTFDFIDKLKVVNGEIAQEDITAFISAISEEGTVKQFILAIGLLIGTMKITQSLGAMGSSFGANLANSAKVKGLSLGGGALKRASGYNYASGAVKGYMGMKKSRRDDKIRLASEKLAYGVGKAKETLIAKPLSKIGSGIKTASTFNRWKNKASGIDKQVIKDKVKLAEIQSNVKDKKDFDLEGSSYVHNTITKKWDKYEKNTNNLQQGDLAEDEVYSNMETKFESMIDTKQKKSDSLKKTQGRWDKGLKYGVMGTGGAIAGALTGGAGWAALAGAGAGYAGGSVGMSKLGKNIKEAGKPDLALASNFNTKQINTEKDAMKLDSDDKVLATIDDSTKSTFERAAASMEAMSRKLLDLNTVTRKREQINKDFKEDRKVMGQVEAILERNYVGASNTFKKLDNPAEREQAKRDIRANYESGAYTMKDMDNKSLAKSIEQLALGLKTGKFVSQFKDLNGSKQATVIRALKQDGSYGSKEKLAHVTDISTAFGSAASADKISFTRNLNIDKLNETLTKGTSEQSQALKDAIAGNAANLSQQVRDAMANSNNRIAQSIKGDLSIP